MQLGQKSSKIVGHHLCTFPNHTIVLQIKTKQFYDHIVQKLAKTQKSTNNPMSNFGLVEENMQLFHIHFTVLPVSKSHR